MEIITENTDREVLLSALSFETFSKPFLVIHRSWDKLFCQLEGHLLGFYKDAKHAKTVSKTYFTPITITLPI